MVKRKTAKKRKAVSKKKSSPSKSAKPAVAAGKKDTEKLDLPMPAFLLQILAVVLAGILIVALTLYVLGKMPARGFWILAVILAVIAFVIMPVMRKKFLGEI